MNIANQILTTLIVHNVVVANRIVGIVIRQCSPVETIEEFGDFGIIVPQHCMHQMDANHVANQNNIDIDTDKAVRNVEGIDGISIEENRNHCVPHSVIDVINISGQWKTLKDKTDDEEN